MDGFPSQSARGFIMHGAVVLLVGAVLLALPASVAVVLGLALLYAIAALAIVTGGVNFLNALRVREIAGWLLPVSALVLALGFGLLAAPAGLGSGVTRGLGAAVVLAGGLRLFAAIRSERVLRTARAAARSRALPAAR